MLVVILMDRENVYAHQIITTFLSTKKFLVTKLYANDISWDRRRFYYIIRFPFDLREYEVIKSLQISPFYNNRMYTIHRKIFTISLA